MNVFRELRRSDKWYLGGGKKVLWAPEFPATSQDDASISVSPEMYRRVMLPADQRTLGRRMEVFHLHSGGLHVLPHIAESLAGRALNVSLDPSGPHVAQILPILKEVHAGGIPMHLYTFDPMTTDLVVAELAQGKLAVLYQPTDA